MSAIYIHHVTLATGHTRRSPRSEVGDDVVALLQHDIAEAVAEKGRHVPIEWVGDYTLTASAEGRCMVATVWGPAVDGVRPPVVTIGVATHSRCGSRLWRTLHETATGLAPATDPDRCPPEPWVAARLEAGALLRPDAMSWLGDYERCLAWAWLEMRGRS